MMSDAEDKKLPNRKRVLCGNPDCKKFLCEIEIHIPERGEIAEVFDLKCPKCKYINSFKVAVRDKDKEKKGEK
jgi:phage FluMu protein Com